MVCTPTDPSKAVCWERIVAVFWHLFDFENVRYPFTFSRDEAVAETLGVKQSSVSKILHGQDMYLSTLDKVLRAMGGELEVYVALALPDGKVRLSLDQFRNVAKEAEHRAQEKRSHRATVAVLV
jgi:plasmid maintenance system antidote protein VapI